MGHSNSTLVRRGMGRSVKSEQSIRHTKLEIFLIKKANRDGEGGQNLTNLSELIIWMAPLSFSVEKIYARCIGQILPRHLSGRGGLEIAPTPQRHGEGKIFASFPRIQLCTHQYCRPRCVLENFYQGLHNVSSTKGPVFWDCHEKIGHGVTKYFYCSFLHISFSLAMSRS